MLYYIYKIENQVNHKKYIGLTNNIARRRNRHFTDLRCQRHDNGFLQKEFNIYGEENFSFNIEFEGNVSVDKIGELEQEYIKKYDSYRNGYNQNEGGNFGPSNGGSHLTQTDIFCILAALEFTSRPGQILSDIYEVSKATISRIKLGQSHIQYKREYEQLPYETRKKIYDTFCESTNFIKKKVNTTIIKSKRQLKEEDVHLIFANEEMGRPLTIQTIMDWIGVKSSNTIYCVLRGETYKDYALTYKDLSNEQKEELVVSLLGDE